MLFLLYINDLPDVIKNTNISLFADDTKLYTEVSNVTTCNKIQNDIDALHRWSLQWKLPFNACKCKERSQNPVIYDYTICGTKLERVKEYVFRFGQGYQ